MKSARHKKGKLGSESLHKTNLSFDSNVKDKKDYKIIYTLKLNHHEFTFPFRYKLELPRSAPVEGGSSTNSRPLNGLCV